MPTEMARQVKHTDGTGQTEVPENSGCPKRQPLNNNG